MNRQLLIQRAVIVLVLAAALALVLAAVLESGTSPTVKVVSIGVLAGFIAGGLVVAARGGEK